MVIDARIPMSGNPLGFYDAYSTGVNRGQQQKANALAMQQAETAGKEQTLQKIARGVLGSNDPAAAYKQGLAIVAQMGGKVDGLPPEWGPDAEMVVRMYAADPAERTEFERMISGLPPEEARKALMIKLGMVPDANAELRGRTGDPMKAPSGYRYSESGNLEFIPGGPADPKVKDSLRGNNMRAVYDDKGNLIYYEGSPEGAKLGRAASNEAEKSLVANEMLGSNLKRVGELVGFDPATGKISEEARRLFTYEGQISAGTTRIRDKLEGVPVVGDLVEPSAEAREFAKKRQVVMQGIDQMFNDYRQEITGAAAAVQELERLKKTFLNSDMGPDEFEAVFAETARKLERIRSTYVELLQRGYDTKTERGGAALDRILSGQATIDDYPATGGTADSSLKAPGEMSDEEIRKELGLD